MPTAAHIGPNMAAFPHRETVGLASHSSSHADTGTQGEGGEFCVCIYVCDRSSGAVCALQGPWAEGERAGANRILSHLSWVGSRALQGLMKRGGN